MMGMIVCRWLVEDQALRWWSSSQVVDGLGDSIVRRDSSMPAAVASLAAASRSDCYDGFEVFEVQAWGGAESLN
jgi:hypothetical protein